MVVCSAEAEDVACGAGGVDRGGERAGGATCELSPDRTPTNETPSMPLQSGIFYETSDICKT